MMRAESYPLRPLQLNSFFAGLSGTLQAVITGAGHISSYEQGQMIHQRGDPGGSFSVIESGAVRFSNTDMEGSTNVLSTLGAGEAFGELTLFANVPRAYDAHAAQQTRLRVISKIQLNALMDDHPQLRDHLISHVTRQLYRSLQLLSDERRLPLNKRLAKLLLSHAAIDDGHTQISVLQSDLAEELAVSRVALGKALKYLSEQGLVSTGYGKIDIPDIAVLRSWIADQ